MRWDELSYWNSGEWQVVQERLEILEKAGGSYNPNREDLFKALDATPWDEVRVMIVGQDPYPDIKYATGLAFSIPRSVSSIPPTLTTILQEYADDLHHPFPKNGNLEKWVSQGVLLWNAIPSCETGKSLSHNWVEWSYLTNEIITSLSDKGNIIFVLLGGVARRYKHSIDTTRNSLIETSHPSPRGNLHSKIPFSGSRPFSTINDKLRSKGQEPIDWKLENYQPVQSPHRTTEIIWSVQNTELLPWEDQKVLSTVVKNGSLGSKTSLKKSPKELQK